jgi:hypothetical protein
MTKLAKELTLYGLVMVDMNRWFFRHCHLMKREQKRGIQIILSDFISGWMKLTR